MDDGLHIRPVKTDGRSSATASSRAAANLSMERLYRKRAIDRENQRVLRQKNKARLAELESEVRALTERLAQAEAEKAQAAARTQTSSSLLDAVISSLQSLQVSLASASSVGSEGGSTPGSLPVAATATASSLSPSPAVVTAAGGAGNKTGDRDQPMTGDPPGSAGPPGPPPAYTGETLNLNLDNLDFWGAGASVTVPEDESNPFQNSDFSLDIDLLTRSLPLFAGAGQPPNQNQNQSRQSQGSPTQLHSPLQHLCPPFPTQLPPLVDHTQTSTGTSTGLRHTPGSIDVQAPPPPPPSAAGDSLRRNPHDDTGAVYLARVEANRLRDASPIWSITPTYVPPTSNIDELIINLVYKRRRGPRAGAGGVASASAASAPCSSGASASAPPPSDEFTHADFPSVSSLLNPVLYEPDKPVASTIARHVAGTIMVYTTPEKTALLYMMCIYIRWLIAPTREHYDSIPAFFRPTAAQLAVPHPFWIDTLGWPRVRERLVNEFDHTRYRDFASVIVASFSIGWPHSALEGILEGSAERGYVMTRAFVQHVREPRNWTVGPALVEAFPFLDGALNVRGRPPVSF